MLGCAQLGDRKVHIGGRRRSRVPSSARRAQVRSAIVWVPTSTRRHRTVIIGCHYEGRCITRRGRKVVVCQHDMVTSRLR